MLRRFTCVQIFLNSFGPCNPLIQPVRDEVSMFYLGYKTLCRLAHLKQHQYDGTVNFKNWSLLGR